MRKATDIENWTVSSWRVEPRIHVTDEGLDDSPEFGPAPPLWTDLATGTVVAILLWIAAAALLG